MTGLVILIVVIILIGLIAQAVVLALLWGQQQRSQVRADVMARLLGVTTGEDRWTPPLGETTPDVSRIPTPLFTDAVPESPDAAPVREAVPAPEKPAAELTFPPPVRQSVVSSAREPVTYAGNVTSPPATRERAATLSGDAILENLSGSGESFAAPDRDRGAAGLPAGSVLPDFELRTIDGARFRRAMITGSRTMMIFLAVDSPGSSALMETIRSSQVRKRSLPDLVLVLDGGVEPESLRRWLGKLHKRVTVLLQEDTELATVLRVPGTPAAYMLDEQCRTRGPLRTGARSILEALGVGAAQMTASARRSTNLTPHTLITQRTFSGLPVGAAAPDLSLPLLNGGVWDGAPGRVKLLIFWDPECPPCRAMQADLARRVERWTGFDTLLVVRGISAGDPLIAELEPAIPIVVQRGFDVSRQFQLLESPAAVVIGADGTIARPPAIGASAVLSLAQDLHERTRRAAFTSEQGNGR